MGCGGMGEGRRGEAHRELLSGCGVPQRSLNAASPSSSAPAACSTAHPVQRRRLCVRESAQRHVSIGPCIHVKFESHLPSAPSRISHSLLVNDTVEASIQYSKSLVICIYSYLVRAWSNSELSDARLLQVRLRRRRSHGPSSRFGESAAAVC